MSAETKESPTFDKCVSNKISTIAHDEPDVKPDQRQAIAYSVCRKKFGISKANILFLFEKSQLFEEELLESITANMAKGMKSADWIEFAAILKKEGKTHKEICDRVQKSESWIKKYVNPILKEVTPRIKLVPPTDTTGQLKPGLPIHTILKFTVKELKKETRTFGGWGSVEVLDSQREIVSIEGLEAIMPTYMKRGAPIMFGHSNRHVGNVFKYKITEKLVEGKDIPALWLEGRIHSDYKIDDLAWEALQYAHEHGLPILSLGATPVGHPEILCNDVACFKKYTEFQLYEFTIAELHKGKVGSNPETQVEVALVKQKEIKAVDSAKKREIGQHLLQLKKSSTLPETDTDLVNMMLATCGSCQDEYKQMIKQGTTEEEAKASLLEGMLEAMSSVEKDTDLDNEISDLQAKLDSAQKKQAAEQKKTATLKRSDSMPESANPDLDKELDKEAADLAAAITKIDARLDKIERSITKTTANIGDTNAATADSKKQAPVGEEEEDEETPNEAAKKKDKDSKSPAALTFSKDFEKHMDLYLQQKGFTKVAETPVPGTSGGREITEIQKGVANIPEQQSKFPSREEMSDAMANWNQGGITKLSKKYGFD